MYIKRSIYQHLVNWKIKSSRKVLLLRGARQVGKTFIVRQFAKTFSHFVEINFIDQPQVKSLFSENSLDSALILESLSAYTGSPIIKGETLVFFDEIQACPEAITALRFFYEKFPDLHVVASGSLLEFALENVLSFGVGRIEYLYMYPVTYQEFLSAAQEDLLLDRIKKSSPNNPLPEVLHLKSLNLLKTYLSLGGMPEVLVSYFESRDLNYSNKLLSTIVTAYEDDFAKYGKRIDTEQLRETFRSAALQAGKKFIYSHAYRDAQSKLVHSALQLIVKAGIVHKVYHSSANGIPLGSEIDLSKFKTIPLDIGVFNRLCGITASDLSLVDPLALINKGSLAEAYCGLELLWSQEPFAQEDLFYWHREAKSSNAEVDYVFQQQEEIFPIEVKSSGKGAMRSMRVFLGGKGHKLGVRVSTENFGRVGDIIIVPLYAVGELRRILSEDNGKTVILR